MKVLKLILRIILYVTGGVMVLLLLLGSMTQTQFFRDRLRAFALAELDSLLVADVTMGDLHGNLVTGFSVDGFTLSLDGDTLLSASQVGVRYDLFEIPGRTISLHTVVLDHPTIHLLRSRSGVWNIERIAEPAPADTTPSRFDWAIQLRRLDIRQGVVTLVDSTALDEPRDPEWPRDALNYDHLTLREFTLGLSFSMRDDVYRAGITRLGFAVEGSPLRVKQISGDFHVSPSQASVTDMRILTDSSHVLLSAMVDKVDLFGGITLEGLRTCSTSVDLSVDPVNFHELGLIIPPIHFLNGNVLGMLQAAGPFGALPIQALDLRLGDSRILLSGTVSNLHDPGNLALDVHMKESRIAPGDPLTLLPSFDLPNFQSLGPVKLDVRYKGTPLDFTTRMAIETEGGAIRSDDFALTIGGPPALRYRGTVAFDSVNLARVLDQEGLATDLHGSITIDGSGVNLRKVNATVQARLDSSTIRGLSIHDADIQVRARDRKVNGVLQVAIGAGHYDVTASLDETAQLQPTFSFDGTATGVNFAELFREERHASNVTMIMHVAGSGLTMETLGGDVLVTMTDSRYGSYALEEGDIHLTLDQRDTLHKSLTISSPVLDGSVEGHFDLGHLGRLARFETQNVGLALNQNFARFDSVFRTEVDTVALARLRKSLEKEQRTVDCKYTMHLKDLELISLVVGEREFDGAAELDGTLRGSLKNLTATTHLAVQEFYYGDVASGLLVEGGDVVVKAVNLKPEVSYHDADLQVQATARMLNISSTELDSLGVDIRLKDRQASYHLYGSYNREAHVDVRGAATLHEDTVYCEIDETRAGYRGLLWEADPGARVVLRPGGIAVSGLVLRRQESAVTVSGALGPADALSASVKGTALNLKDIGALMSASDELADEGAFGGTLDADIAVSGTLQQPGVKASFSADGIALRQIPFGRLYGDVGFADGVLDLHCAADVTNGRVADGPELTIEGSIPLVRDDKSIQDNRREFQLSLRSAGTPITILDPVLPNFNELSGMLECDLTISGTAERPRYAGSLQLSECQFLFEANNMYYLVDGTFQGVGDRITVKEATIRNVPGDERDGQSGLVRLGGDFALRNFTPGDFNLTATGQLHVVKEATRKSTLSLYGDLFAEIGRGGLHFTGDIRHSLLRGAVSIRNSNLIFPPTEQVIAEESALSVPIIIYDDTSKYGEKGVLSAADRYFGSQAGAGTHSAKELEGSVSFLEGLRYDLDIETTGGTTSIRMIFNQISSEELVATIDGRFSITEDGRRWLGDLTVSRAYYSFYRRFDAEGRIQFTGDFMDPELDIKATYTGTRAVRDTAAGGGDERIVVTVNITGPRSSARLSMSMTIDGVDYYSYNGLKSNDVQSDALGFVIYGNFPLTVAEKGEVSAELEKTFRRSILTGASSLLTGTLSEFLRSQTGFINSVELNFNTQAGATESADIRLSGVAWSGYWRYGGQILDDPLGNADFSVLYSFGSIFNNPSLRNFMMELESKVERGTFGQATDLRRVNSARLFYRFSF